MNDIFMYCAQLYNIIFMQLKEDSERDVLNSDQTTVSVRYSTEGCLGEDSASCIGKLLIQSKSKRWGLTTIGFTTAWSSGSINPPVVASVNGTTLEHGRSFYNEELFVHRTTNLYWSIQSFGFHCLYDRNGRIYIYMEPVFVGKVSNRLSRNKFLSNISATVFRFVYLNIFKYLILNMPLIVLLI